MKRLIRSKWFKIILKLIIGAVLIYLIIQKIDFEKLISGVKQLPWLVFLLVIIVPLIMNSLNARMFQVCFSISKNYISFSHAIKSSFISNLSSLAIPGLIAPDFYLVAHYGKKFGDHSTVISNIIFLRSIGLIIMAIFSIVSMFVVGERLYLSFENQLTYIHLIVFIAGFLVFALVSYYFKKKFLIFYRSVKSLIYSLRDNKTVLYKLIGLKFARYVASIGFRVIIAFLIGIDLSFIELFFIIILVNFLVSIPISIGGIGVREVSYVSLLALFAISEEPALILSFVDFLLLLVNLLVGFVLFSTNKFAK